MPDTPPETLVSFVVRRLREEAFLPADRIRVSNDRIGTWDEQPLVIVNAPNRRILGYELNARAMREYRLQVCYVSAEDYDTISLRCDQLFPRVESILHERTNQITCESTSEKLDNLLRDNVPVNSFIGVAEWTVLESKEG